jgi:YidC/Oxa1 family membrane protein insertase
VFDAAVGVAHSTIEGLAAFLIPITGGTSVAVAIVLFTVGVRLFISPLSYLQIRGARRRAALAPELTELQRKHRDNPATLASETLALYRANGAGPLAGLLPGLVQAPFFMIMYRIALDAPAGSLAGVPLSAHVLAGLPVFAGLFAIALALAWLSSRRIRTASGKGTGRDGGALAVVMPWLPFVAVPAVAWLPLAGALYLVTSMAWTALEHSVAFARPAPES